MRRKDGKRKLKAIRSMPVFEHGLRDSPKHQISVDAHDQETAHSVVSMFCGCGGLDLGMLGGFSSIGQRYRQLPFIIECAYDNSSDAIDTYKLNISDHAMLGDLLALPTEAMPPADVLAGGFPCQDFSSSGPKTGLSGKRGQLYRCLVDYMKIHQPRIVIGENVPHLARLNGGNYLRHILQEFESAGYKFRVWNLYGPDYGLPQSRRRLFLVGVRLDIPGFPTPPLPTHCDKYIPIDEALASLESVADESVTNQSQYFVATRASAGGGQGDHTNRTGEVSYCIRANSRGRIQFHYSLPRRLTVRECARLQSFPDEFVFPFSTQRNLTLIGNAVPPILGHRVATSIASFLDGEIDDSPFSLTDSNSGQLGLPW